MNWTKLFSPHTNFYKRLSRSMQWKQDNVNKLGCCVFNGVCPVLTPSCLSWLVLWCSSKCQIQLPLDTFWNLKSLSRKPPLGPRSWSQIRRDQELGLLQSSTQEFLTEDKSSVKSPSQPKSPDGQKDPEKDMHGVGEGITALTDAMGWHKLLPLQN